MTLRTIHRPGGGERDAFARRLVARLSDPARTIDELRVIDDVLAGIEHGAREIGPLDLVSDERDFDEEAAQECRDLLAYLAMRKVADQHRKRERLRCEAADESARTEPILDGLRELRDAFDHGGVE